MSKATELAKRYDSLAIVSNKYVRDDLLADAIAEVVRLDRVNAELVEERDRTARNRDMWKDQCKRQAIELERAHLNERRYLHMRNLPIEQTGVAGQPCIAMPNGMSSGYYLTEETADFAIDAALKEATES